MRHPLVLLLFLAFAVNQGVFFWVLRENYTAGKAAAGAMAQAAQQPLAEAKGTVSAHQAQLHAIGNIEVQAIDGYTRVTVSEAGALPCKGFLAQMKSQPPSGVAITVNGGPVNLAQCGHHHNTLSVIGMGR